MTELVSEKGKTIRRYRGQTFKLALDESVWRELKSGPLTAVRPALNALYRRIEAPPVDARFYRRDTDWQIVAVPGRAVDRQITEQAIKAAIAQGQLEVPVTLRLSSPALTVEKLQERQLAHLGTGESEFTGSPAFRVHNIVVAARAVDGAWIPAGQTFDFNARIRGAQRGGLFQPGYVISGGQLAVEDGGGICQVSTTVFRAALTAGLKIVERHAHSHQVAYYGEPGLDAAVYAPSKNLRLRSPGRSFFMQTEWDEKRAVMRVHVFGTPAPEQVTILPPLQFNVRPALEPQFMVDRNLAPGEAVRVDMPAAGSRVKVVREFRTPQGRVVKREVFWSNYRPWGGAFAVAPGDPRLKSRR